MSKYIAIYEKLCPDDLLSNTDPRRKAIIAEMRGIHRARTDADAVKFIAWWNVWPNPEFKTPLAFVRAAKKLMTIKGKENVNHTSK